MKKDKYSLKWLLLTMFSHPWLKLVSLILAILVWLYAKGEMLRGY